MNIDTLRTNESIQTLLHALNKHEIEIARIQETHNGRIDSEQYNNYTILYGGCNTDKKTNDEHKYTNNKGNCYSSGVAIAIHNNIKHSICNVTRINDRIMELRLNTENKINNISIANSYAHPNYYDNDNDKINDYWGNLNASLQTIPRKLIKLRGTDNNGQVKQDINNYNNIGKWTMGDNNNINTDGRNISDTCIEHNLTCCNTFFIPETEKL